MSYRVRKSWDGVAINFSSGGFTPFSVISFLKSWGLIVYAHVLLAWEQLLRAICVKAI
jgi:hypothetical protein